MKIKTTMRLFAAVCLAGCAIAIVERISRERPSLRENPLPPIENVTLLSMEQGSNRVEAVRRDGAWHIRWPLYARANEGEIEKILTILEGMKIREVITPRQRKQRQLTLTDYGLERPRARFCVSDGVERTVIRIGYDAPLGGGVFFRIEGSDDVYATSAPIMEVIPDDVELLRSRLVLHGESSRVSRLEIQRQGAGFLQFARRDGRWWIQQPIGARADGDKLRQILDALFSLKVERFVWDAPSKSAVGMESNGSATDDSGEGPGILEGYGLTADSAVLRVGVWGEGNDTSQEILFGKAPSDASDRIYVTLRDVKSVYMLKRSILSVLMAEVNDLRERSLFAIEAGDVKCISMQQGDRKVVLRREIERGWVLAEPVEWDADETAVDNLVQRITSLRIERFADGTVTNLAELGLATPVAVIQVLQRLPDRAPAGGVTEPGKAASPTVDRSNRLWIGRPLANSGRMFARFEDETPTFGVGATVCEVSPAAISGLGRDLLNPLVYRDRTMLALHPNSVRRITLIRGEVEQTVARNEKDEWKATIPAAAAIRTETIDDILFFVANLRASRVEGHNVLDLGPYGLDHPNETLRLGMRGEEGIAKSIQLGANAGKEGRYAMIQGQDVVFVIENSTVDRVTKDLVVLPDKRGLQGRVEDSRQVDISPTNLSISRE